MSSIEKHNDSSIPLITLEPIPGLWPRFERVRQVIATSTSSETPLGITRDFETLNWGGADRGIHDYRGSICGNIHNVEFLLNIIGSSADNQPEYYVDERGDMKFRTKKVSSFLLTGHFLSADKQEGAFEILLKNGQPHFEAYWLSWLHGDLILEQVIAPNGMVFSRKDLKFITNSLKEVIIPGTDISKRLYKEKRQTEIE